jgi:signal transduction histidine kinase
MIYNGKQCRLVLMRDVSKIREAAKLSAKLSMVSLISSSVSHEMLVPLRCIVNLVEGIQKKLKDIEDQEYVGRELDLINKTAQLLLNQVKGNLDRDMLSQNMFEPRIELAFLNQVVEEVCGML